jgi:hypothetical protein
MKKGIRVQFLNAALSFGFLYGYMCALSEFQQDGHDCIFYAYEVRNFAWQIMRQFLQRLRFNLQKDMLPAQD